MRKLVLVMAVLSALPAGAARADAGRPVTVVAVVDDAFTPYHWETLGAKHPWAGTPDAIDFTADPAGYIEGFPGAEPLEVTLPSADDAAQNTSGFAAADEASWSRFQGSPNAADPTLYRFPGTKIVGAAAIGVSGRADGAWRGTNSSHGTRSMTSAAGNLRGTCAECVVVLLTGYDAAVAWAASQPWIDVITNSWGQNITPARDNVTFAADVAAAKASSEEGQFVVFSGGNGIGNAFLAPNTNYTSSEKGPDWIITVGAITNLKRQSYIGTGKPVDISSVGAGYPSTGGSTVNGSGSHSGTSNAAPVVAGYIAKTIQAGREALGDTTSGHAGGVVASGNAPCTGCPLADGVMTRREVQDAVFYGVLPTPTQVDRLGTAPSDTYPYIHQGHGGVYGRLDGPEVYDAEWRQMAGLLLGAAPPARPVGEANWFIADSRCRQRLWGAWSGGYYTGGEPTFDPETDKPAIVLDAACTKLPQDVLEDRT